MKFPYEFFVSYLDLIRECRFQCNFLSNGKLMLWGENRGIRLPSKNIKKRIDRH